MKIYDITQELFTCEVYPGDPAPEYERIASIGKGSVCNLTKFSMCAHNGTHVDAPFHFINSGKTVESLELSRMIGPAFVAECSEEVGAEEARSILEEAASVVSDRGRRILLRGGTLTPEGAETFKSSGVLLIGTESQSVSVPKTTAEVHRILLSAEIVLLEGIRLSKVSPGEYFLFSAPLALGGADGAPVRAVLIQN